MWCSTCMLVQKREASFLKFYFDTSRTGFCFSKTRREVLANVTHSEPEDFVFRDNEWCRLNSLKWQV